MVSKVAKSAAITILLICIMALMPYASFADDSESVIIESTVIVK